MNNNRIHITFILVNLHRIHNRTNALCHIIIIQHLFSALFANKHALMQYLNLKVLEKCTKNLIGHSRLAFNNHELNIDC